MKTEAALLQAIATATTLREQAGLVEELDALRADKTAALQADRDTDLTSAILRDTLTPVRVHEHHTASTDWLGDVEETPLDTTHVLAEAALWYQRTSEAVRQDPEELAEQLHGMARRTASQYGPHSQAAYAAFTDYVAFLHGRTGASGLDQIQQLVDAQENAKQTPLPTETFDTFQDPIAPENQGVDEAQSTDRSETFNDKLAPNSRGSGENSEHDTGQGPISQPNYREESAREGSLAIDHLYDLDSALAILKNAHNDTPTTSTSTSTSQEGGGNPTRRVVSRTTRSTSTTHTTADHRISPTQHTTANEQVNGKNCLVTRDQDGRVVQVKEALHVEAVAWGRRHYEDLASAIATHPEADKLAEHFGRALEGTNPNYRQDQFIAAASTPGYRVRGGTGTANYTRGHYNHLAATIADYPGDRDSVAQHFADHLGKGNGQFNRDRFLRASTAASGLDQIQQVVDPKENPKRTPLPAEVAFPITSLPEPQQAHYLTGEEETGPEHKPSSATGSKTGSQTLASSDLHAVGSTSIQDDSARPNRVAAAPEGQFGPSGRVASLKSADYSGTEMSEGHQDPAPPTPDDSQIAPPSGGFVRGYSDGQSDAASNRRPNYTDASSPKPYVQGYSEGYSSAHPGGIPAQSAEPHRNPERDVITLGAARKTNPALQFVSAKTVATKDFQKAFRYATKWAPSKPLVTEGSIEFESGLYAGISTSPHRLAWIEAHQRMAERDPAFGERIEIQSAFDEQLEKTAAPTDINADDNPSGLTDAGEQSPIVGPGTAPPLKGGMDPAAPGGPAPYNAADPTSRPVVPGVNEQTAEFMPPPPVAKEPEAHPGNSVMSFRKKVQAAIVAENRAMAGQ